MSKFYNRRLFVASVFALLVLSVLSVPAAAQNTPALEAHTVGPDDLLLADFGRTTPGGQVQSILQIRTAQTMFESASTPGRGTLRFIDPDREPPEKREMELGFYEWGVGVFSQNLFEFWTSGVSVRNLYGEPSFLAVRDLFDIKDIRLSHDGVNGRITTTGIDPGGIIIEGNGPVAVSALTGNVSLTAEAAVNVNAAVGVTIDGGNGPTSLISDGAVEVESQSADLTLRGASRVTIDGNGPVSLEGDSAVTIEARTGDIALIGATGMHLEGSNGPVLVDAKGVTLNATTGNALVQGTNATVRGTGSAIVQSTAGSVSVDAATNVAVTGAGAVSVIGGGPVTVTGGSVSVSGTGAVGVNGGTVSVNGTGAVGVNGGSVGLTGTNGASMQAVTGNVSLTATAGEVRMSAGGGSPVRVDSTGSLYVPGDIYLKGTKLEPGSGGSSSSSTAPAYANLTFQASQFLAIGGTNASWGVEAADVTTYGYSKSGNIMTVWFLFVRTSISGSPLVLTFPTPENVRALVQAEATCYVADDNQEFNNMPCLVSPNERVIRFYRPSYYHPWPSSTNKTSIRGTISFPFAP